MTNGNGVPTDLQAPLARMWRDVYAKAAGVAEDRSVQLLKEHVYQYPHGAGGGGGGGNWVLVETKTMADATATQVTFSAIPTTGAALVLVVTAHQQVAGGSAGSGVLLLRLNDDASTNYWAKYHEAYGTTSPMAHQVLGDDASSLPLGRLPFADDTSPDTASGATVAWLYGHAVAGRRKQVTAQASAFTGKGSGGYHFLGEYGGEWRGTAAITKLTLLPSGSGATFSTGSVFSLYVITQVAGGGGGGGGGADVTITTDASLTSTESPANTFALAAQISADSGNALSLHANGLFATGGGGGGTGNTTMYTQTTAPTGAANSLWFNPGESA